MINRLVGFTKEVLVEMKRVSWPSRKELINSTSVVILTTIIVGVFLGIVDVVLTRSIGYLLSR
jgi:preprotein translocase subunit SecE